MPGSDKHRFLCDELFSLTLMATVQRGKVYVKGTSDAQKRLFQEGLQDILENTACQYAKKRKVNDEAHIFNISLLATTLSQSYPTILRNRRFRIGSAQKALNLYLKYMWCIGKIQEPPHCPFDYQIIQKLPQKARRNWTAIDSMEEYRSLVAEAKKQARGRSLAKWELQLYNKKVTSRK